MTTRLRRFLLPTGAVLAATGSGDADAYDELGALVLDGIRSPHSAHCDVRVPDDYTASWNKFASLNLVRSDPAITAEVIFRMVTDGDTRKVHYYSGPDGEAIPRVKQLLRQDWYFEELSARNRNEASPLWKSLMPTPTANNG